MFKQVFLKVQTVKGEVVVSPLNCQGLIDNCRVKSTQTLIPGKYYQADLILTNQEFIIDSSTIIELPNAPLKGFIYGKTDQFQKVTQDNQVILGKNNENYLINLTSK